MASRKLFDVTLDNGLLPDGIKPEPSLTLSVKSCDIKQMEISYKVFNAHIVKFTALLHFKTTPRIAHYRLMKCKLENQGY